MSALATVDRRRLAKEARQVVRSLVRHKPAFEFGVAWAESYAALFSGKHEQLGDTWAELLSAVDEHGRVILSAEAGAGKSSIAGRTLEHAADSGYITAFIDLRAFTPAMDKRWRELRSSDRERMALLLQEIGRPRLSESVIRTLADEARCFLVVDGLNEVPPSVSLGILAVLDDFAARNPWAGVLVTDRLVRRELPSDGWGLATIDLVAVRGADSVAVPANALLLDISQSLPSVEFSSSALLEADIVARAKLTNDELDRLAEAALGLYRHTQSRTFSLASLRDYVDESTVARLIGGDVVRTDDDFAYFRHHLLHDVLVARAVSAKPERWHRSTLDDITFVANAFDVLALAVEYIDDPALADRFVIEVYDWNLYGTAYAVARCMRLGTGKVTSGAAVALQAMLADRRWDAIAATVQRVEDALRLFPGELASDLLQAPDRQSVRTRVREVPEPSLDSGWLAIFDGDLETPELIRALLEDPLRGWTASNALRDRRLVGGALEQVIAATRSDADPVRWRAVHVLGAVATDAVVDALLDRLDHDEYPWVRYGAVRSLVEVAAISDDHRPAVIASLRERVPELREQGRVRDELARALVLTSPPRDWAQHVGPLVEDLWASGTSLHEQDHWRRVGYRVRRSLRET